MRRKHTVSIPLEANFADFVAEATRVATARGAHFDAHTGGGFFGLPIQGGGAVTGRFRFYSEGITLDLDRKPASMRRWARAEDHARAFVDEVVSSMTKT